MFHKWEEARMPVKFVWMDGIGENISIDRADWKLCFNYENTARNILQQNHLAKIGFTIFGHNRKSNYGL